MSSLTVSPAVAATAYNTAVPAHRSEVAVTDTPSPSPVAIGSDIVTLSPEAQTAKDTDTAGSVKIPGAVLENMKAFATTKPTAYTDQIDTLSERINDRTAADEDRFAAWKSLKDLLADGKVYLAGNVADLQKALDATQTSDYAKSLDTLTTRYDQVQRTEAARLRDSPRIQLNSLDRFSEGDQQKIFHLFGMDGTYASLDDWKADYSRMAAAYDTDGTYGGGQRPTVSQPGYAEIKARVGLANADAQSTEVEAGPLEAILQPTSFASHAEVALSMIRKMNEAAETAKTDAAKAERNALSETDIARRLADNYQPGSLFSTGV